MPRWLKIFVQEKSVVLRTIFAVLVVAGCAYLARHRLILLAFTKEQAAFWNVAFTGIGGIVAIVGAALTISKYLDEKHKETRAALVEAQKPFTTKRQEVYYNLVSATAKLGTKDPDGEDGLWKGAADEFWLLYWGALPLVEDDQVAAAVDAFSEALDNAHDGTALRNASMDLARACRASLGFVDTPT